MASEIRANTLKNRVGLGTVSYTDTGIVVSGIVTANSFSFSGAGDLDVDGHTNLDNVSIAGVTTFSEDTKFIGGISGRDLQWDKSDNTLEFLDYTAAKFGTDNNLTIYHNAGNNNTYITESGAGSLLIGASDLYLQDVDSGTGHYYMICATGGRVQLNHDNNEKFRTTSSGISITGNISATGNLTPSGTLYLTDAIEHTDDSNTKIRFPAVDTVSVETAGSERLRIDINGNMGLGTLLASDAGSAGAGLKIEKYVQRNNIYAFPDGWYGASLGEVQNTENKVWASVDSHYNRSSAISAGLFLSAFHADAGGSGCGSAIKNLKAGNALTFSTVTTGASVGSVAVETERLRITSGGSVNIGGSTQTSKTLYVDGTIEATSNLTCVNQIYLSGTAPQLVFTDTNQDSDYTIKNDGGQLVFIDRTNSNAVRMYANTGGFGGDRLYIANDIVHTGDTDTKIEFGTDTINFDTAGSERLRIASTGKIYVGADSTNFSDAGTFFNLKHDGYGGRIGFSNNTATAGATLMEQFAYWGTNKVAGFIALAGTDTSNKDDGLLKFYTRKSGQSALERLLIDTEGRVGINRTPALAYSKLEVGGADNYPLINVEASGVTGGLGVGNNALKFYYGTSLKWRITSSGELYPEGNYKIGLNSNTAFRMSEVNSNKFVHRYGTSNSAGTNEQEAIWYGGGITVMHDNATLQTTNYTWGLTGSRGYALLRIRNNAGSPQAIYAEAGSISSGSDYRMKENIEEITNGIETVKKLKPSIYNIRKTFNPNDDGKKHHGFIAHEVQEAIPNIGNIVSGTKDAMEEVFYQDEDENIPEGKKPGDSTGTFTDNPDMQGIDYGHITPVLAAAIKEIITKVETLEAKVTALEGS